MGATGRRGDAEGTLQVRHYLADRLPHVMEFRGTAGTVGRIADREEGIDPVFAGFGEDFPYLAGVEVPDPHVGQPGVRGREHQVRQDDGGVGFRRVDAVAFAYPGLFVPASDDQDKRRAVAGVDRPEPGEGFLAPDGPDPGGLEIARRRGQPPGFKDHVQLGVGDGVLGEGVA